MLLSGVQGDAKCANMQWNVWNHQWSWGSWDVRFQSDCRNSRTWKDEGGFRPPQHFDIPAVCLIVFKRRLQAGCSLCDPLLVHENMLKNRQLLLRFLRLLSFWVVCLFVFFSCTCPEPPAGGATEPPGPWASWLVPQFPDFWTPETSAPPLQEPAASLWASRRLPRYLTCISACVYLLSHGEHLGLNAVQWLSLSTMTKNLHFCGNFYLIHLRKWFY